MTGTNAIFVDDREPDITITDCGTFAIIFGETETGLAWLKQNLVSDVWQWNGNSIAVDSRMCLALLDEALDADLAVAA